jgi:SAM-dependent methyltransferase
MPSIRDVRRFSGRGADEAATAFISRRILKELSVQPGDRLVDIGCGDGMLLRFALDQGAGRAIGVSGSEEEARCLREWGLDVRQAYTHALTLPDRCASMIVCNSVLHIVSPAMIPASLQEIARIAEPAARVWIGEIPGFREDASLRKFANIPAMLWWLLVNRGVRSFIGMCRRVLAGKQTEPVLKSAQAFWAEPEEFIGMAWDAGLVVERHFPHESIDAESRTYVSATRHDYLFRKS